MAHNIPPFVRQFADSFSSTGHDVCQRTRWRGALYLLRLQSVPGYTLVGIGLRLIHRLSNGILGEINRGEQLEESQRIDGSINHCGDSVGFRTGRAVRLESHGGPLGVRDRLRCGCCRQPVYSAFGRRAGQVRRHPLRHDNFAAAACSPGV